MNREAKEWEAYLEIAEVLDVIEVLDVLLHTEVPEAGPSLGTCNVCDGTGPPLFRGLQIYIEYIYVYMYCLVNKNVQQ